MSIFKLTLHLQTRRSNSNKGNPRHSSKLILKSPNSHNSYKNQTLIFKPTLSLPPRFKHNQKNKLRPNRKLALKSLSPSNSSKSKLRYLSKQILLDPSYNNQASPRGHRHSRWANPKNRNKALCNPPLASGFKSDLRPMYSNQTHSNNKNLSNHRYNNRSKPYHKLLRTDPLNHPC